MNSRLSSSWVKSPWYRDCRSLRIWDCSDLERAVGPRLGLVALIMEVRFGMGAAVSHAAANEQQLQQSLNVPAAAAGARGIPLVDTHKAMRQIMTVVHAESSAQKLFSLRISQTQDFNRNACMSVHL